MEKILTIKNLLFVFGRRSADEIQFTRNNLITMTLKALHKIQADYSETDCLDPKEFFKKLYPEGIRSDGFLSELVDGVWQKNPGLEGRLNRLVKAIRRERLGF